MIRIGAIFPQTEIGTDPGAIREYAQAVEGLSYRQLLIYDHVLGCVGYLGYPCYADVVTDELRSQDRECHPAG